VDTNENVRMPVPMMRVSALKAAPTPAPTEEFSPQNVTITAHVNAMFVLK
jgi:hypothetical protein